MTSIGEDSLIRNLFFLTENQATTANNLANVSSNGFKRRISVPYEVGTRFEDQLQHYFAVSDSAQHVDWRVGNLIATDSPNNIALQDQHLFLKVRTKSGLDAYSRNGDLTVDPENRLSTRSGDLLLGESGEPVVIKPADGGPAVDFRDVRISPNGSVEVRGSQIARLGLYRIDDLNSLQPVGGGSYTYFGSSKPVRAQTNAVLQTYLEQSNVESVHELVQMISNQRGFQSSSSALQTLGKIKEAYATVFSS
ncbi:MAG: flagellar hook basal-body protein [Planctomycetes bacterium]|nr:flagellar hook basal-body protein [Planctomycetota bacterium]MCB9871991.1 flagellar hook basal-body protein [Planctomycetota bacterium]MCB9888396.1 flagellar hook basal-body protein [Planctomycetota bacterium]